MNNPWEFGWEAIAAIVSILALVLFFVVEWDRINERIDFGYAVIYTTAIVISGGMGVTIGYTISQTLIWWRLVALVLGAVAGGFFIAALSDDDTYKGRTILLLLMVILGVMFGLWLANFSLL